MNVLVVDDELLARKRAMELLEKLHHITEVDETGTGKEAVHLLLTKSYDLVLLDIQLTDMTGFDVLLQIPSLKRPSIIFITAYDEFAIEAFEVRAIDYLQKPYKDKRFYDALSRVEKRNQENIESLIQYMQSNLTLVAPQDRPIDNVVIKKGNNYYFVPTDEIKYIISSAYYAEIFTEDNNKHIYRISLNEFIVKLNNNFMRINRSAIIHNRFIKEIISEGMGGYSIVMKDGKSFSLSKKYKDIVLAQLNIRNKSNE